MKGAVEVKCEAEGYALPKYHLFPSVEEARAQVAVWVKECECNDAAATFTLTNSTGALIAVERAEKSQAAKDWAEWFPYPYGWRVY